MHDIIGVHFRRDSIENVHLTTYDEADLVIFEYVVKEEKKEDDCSLCSARYPRPLPHAPESLDSGMTSIRLVHQLDVEV